MFETKEIDTVRETENNCSKRGEKFRELYKLCAFFVYIFELYRIEKGEKLTTTGMSWQINQRF